MEKVTDLFRAFRNKQIEYDELFGELTKMLSEDPHFSGQAIASLDSAQQQTPIPVTDFINLRAKLESTAETFHQQEASAGPADAEGTLVFDADDATTAAHDDPTLIGNNGSSESAAPAAQASQPVNPEPPVAAPIVEDDYADEATVIMPMPPRKTAAPANISPQVEPAPAAEGNMEATLIATPISDNTQTEAIEEDEHATLVVAPAPAPISEPIAEPIATALPEETHAEAMPPQSETGGKPAAPTKTKSSPINKPPVALIAAGAAAVVVILLVVIMWGSDSEPTDEVATTPPAASESNEASPWGSQLPVSNSGELNTAEGMPPQSNNTDSVDALEAETTETSVTIENIESEITASSSEEIETTTELVDNSLIEPQEADPIADEINTESTEAPDATIPAEPAIKDEAYYVSAISKAVDNNDLGPAEKQGSATFYLVELIKLNQQSPAISDARTLISKKHIQLSKESRSNNRWEEAQQHLDDALKVRLPDSYLPE